VVEHDRRGDLPQPRVDVPGDGVLPDGAADDQIGPLRGDGLDRRLRPAERPDTPLDGDGRPLPEEAVLVGDRAGTSGGRGDHGHVEPEQRAGHRDAGRDDPLGLPRHLRDALRVGDRAGGGRGLRRGLLTPARRE
jgi:hypothetical protein